MATNGNVKEDEWANNPNSVFYGDALTCFPSEPAGHDNNLEGKTGNRPDSQLLSCSPLDSEMRLGTNPSD